MNIFCFFVLFSFLIINLFFPSSFVLAYTIEGDIWEFDTWLGTYPPVVPPSTPPAPPSLPAPELPPGLPPEPKTVEGDIWEFDSWPGTHPPVVPPPTPPTPPSLPAPELPPGVPPEPKTIEGDIWEFDSWPGTHPPVVPPPTPPAPPFLPAPGQTAEGEIIPIEIEGDIWYFNTEDLPKGTDLKITFQNYCSETVAGQGMIGFQWIYSDEDDDRQTGYDFVVNDVNDVNDPNPEIYREVRELDNPSNTINTTSVLVRPTPEKDIAISYNTIYYWWIRVYNDKNQKSDWQTGPPFNTPSHPYPFPNFQPTPISPKTKEEVVFLQNMLKAGATCYQGGESPCQEDPNAFYSWDFGYDSGIDSNFKGDATTSYDNAGNYEIKLEIRDLIGTCSIIKSLTVEPAVPAGQWKWKEIAP